MSRWPEHAHRLLFSSQTVEERVIGMTESSNQTERISEFEHGRRNRETANELLIHATLGSLTLIASILMLAVVLLPTSFIQPPVSVIIAEALVALLCGIVYITLKKNPGYFA